MPRTSPGAYHRKGAAHPLAVGTCVRGLSRAEIQRLLELLDDELRTRDVLEESCLVGGAVMCLALNAREATRDVDAFFRPTAVIRRRGGRGPARGRSSRVAE